MTRIYVALVDENVEVYRPDEATALPGGLFRITTVRTDPDEAASRPARS